LKIIPPLLERETKREKDASKRRMKKVFVENGKIVRTPSFEAMRLRNNRGTRPHAQVFPLFLVARRELDGRFAKLDTWSTEEVGRDKQG